MGILTTEPKTANMLKHKPQIIKGIVTKLTPPSFEAPRTPWTIPFSSYVSMELCLDLEAKMKQRKKKRGNSKPRHENVEQPSDKTQPEEQPFEKEGITLRERKNRRKKVKRNKKKEIRRSGK